LVRGTFLEEIVTGEAFKTGGWWRMLLAGGLGGGMQTVKTREIERAGRRWFVLGEGPGLAGVEKSFRTLREALAWCRAKGYPVKVYRVTKKGMVIVEEHDLKR